jgi:hypothetical protein
MSTIKVNSINHNDAGFNSIVKFASSAGVENGTLCRLWCKWHYSGGTPTIGDDFNVSSLSDLGTGYVRVNFSNDLHTSNYAITCGNNLGNSATTQVIGSVSSGSFEITLRYDGGTTYDVSYNSCIVMSDG